MTEILLEEKYGEKGKYLGKIVCQVEDLTPERLAKIKADKDDKLGWKKYRGVMKKAGFPIE